MTNDIILGWILGVAGSVISGIVLFWLQSRRDIQLERLRQRREDVRTARNWAKDGKTASLRGFDLVGANLSGKDLSGADLEDANFEGAEMWATNLSGANLIRANFQKAKMYKTKFNDANLLLADFKSADMKEVDFTGANLRRTKLKEPKRTEKCLIAMAKIDDTTELNQELLRDIEVQRASKTDIVL